MIKIVDKKRFFLACLSLILLVVIFLAVGYFFYKFKGRNGSTEIKSSEIVENVSEMKEDAAEKSKVIENNKLVKKEEVPLTEYVNSRYKYSLVFPDNWHINNDSSESPIEKPQGDDLLEIPFGGQTFWSNYKDINSFTPETKPDDFRLLNLTIYEKGQLTLEDFIKKLGFEADFEKNDLQATSAVGLELKAEGIVENNPKNVFIFWNDQYFYVFNLAFLGNDSEAEAAMRKIVLSFQLKK